MKYDAIAELRDHVDIAVEQIRNNIKELAGAMKAVDVKVDTGARTIEARLDQLQAAIDPVLADLNERVALIETVLGSVVQRLERLEGTRVF